MVKENNRPFFAGAGQVGFYGNPSRFRLIGLVGYFFLVEYFRKEPYGFSLIAGGICGIDLQVFGKDFNRFIYHNENSQN